MKIFLIAFFIGLFLGSIVAFVVFSCIAMGKEYDESIERDNQNKD